MVRIDDMLVEVQIRTELQDTWAQIVERLADRWGRGIRYGQDPEDPERTVRSGELEISRRQALTTLMSLSDAISAVEQTRRSVETAEQSLKLTNSRLEELRGREKALPGKARSVTVTQSLTETQKGILAHEQVTAVLANFSEQLDAEGQELLNAGTDVTLAQLTRMIEIGHDLVSRDNSERGAKLAANERRLRDILKSIASATDEGA